MMRTANRSGAAVVRRWLSLALAAACLFVSSIGNASPVRTLYTIAIGHNDVPSGAREADNNLVSLRYADDDAVRFYSLFRAASRSAHLLAVLDSDTQRRFPELAAQALSPTQDEIDRVVDAVKASMERDVAAGREPSLAFFFSGHGLRDTEGEAGLSVLGGTLTRRWLYERLFARLPARFIHVIIDACHAEAFVRPRDVDAQVVKLNDAERRSYVEAATLSRFPGVGVVLASAANAQSFEWDGYRGGVFAHELLSGLRGAADVNADGVVEYSEIAAFLAAANAQVADPRARLAIVVQPPRADRRAPLFARSGLSGQFVLAGRAVGQWSKPFFVETESGDRVLDVFSERGAAISVALPANERMYVVGADGEALTGAAAGARVSLESLRFATAASRPRGSLATSMERGLFGNRFGPAFYGGYLSDRDKFVAVPTSLDDDEPASEAPRRVTRGHSGLQHTLGVGLLVGSGALAVSAGIFVGVALDARADYSSTDLEQPAAEARARFLHYRTLAWASGGASLAFAISGASLLLWPSHPTSAPVGAVRVDRIVATASGLSMLGSF